MLTQNEQLYLELVNAARLDPKGEAERQGNALNEGLDAGTIPDTPVQPLAANAQIQEAAAGHSQWMLDTDTLSHTGEGGSDPGDRMTDADYVFEGTSGWGENIALWRTTGTVDLLDAIKAHHDGLYKSPGHRENLFRPHFRETGISQENGVFEAGWNASILTQKFGVSGGDVFLTGAVFDDTDKNGSYSVGEGTDGFAVSAADAETSTWASGGYSVGVASNAATTVTLGNGDSPIQVTVDLSGDNVKLDLVDGAHILTSGDVILGAGASVVKMLGALDNSVTGNGFDNTFHIGRGDNTVVGGGGTDRAVFTGQSADYDIVDTGDDYLVAHLQTGSESDGKNSVQSVEYLEFSDKTVSLLPQGEGTILSGRLSAPDGTEIAETALRFSLSDGTETTLTTDATGSFDFLLPDGETGHLTMAPGAISDTPPDVSHALDVLRLAVGLEPSFGPTTPHDIVAADVDFSGNIKVDDALNTLRAAVGLDTGGARPGSYVILTPDQSLGGLTADAINYDRGMALDHGLAEGILDIDVVVLGDLGALNAV